MADRTPNPHRDEPTPQPEEGLRPEADPSIVRPEQEEPNGPLAGLMSTAGAEVVAELTDSPEAEEQLEAAGVEDEGIESGQIMGITLAILVSVGLMAIVVYWGFYQDTLTDTEIAAESVVDELPEGRNLRAQAAAVMGDYSLSPDSTYRLPIDVAMGIVAATYSGAPADSALAGEAVTDDAPMAMTRAGFNVAPIALAPARAVRAPSTRGAFTAPTPETATDEVEVIDDVDLGTGEEVGADETPELIPDPTPEAEE